ncbi:MAG: S9 family peptidase, partial [Firmicutes bacterium]|nr:S9 family peptidase [Bacillota bacterium]
MSAKRVVQERDLLKFKLPGEPQISPTGDRIVYSTTWVNEKDNKYESTIYQVVPGQKPVRLTGCNSDSRPEFSPDGKTLAFLSKRSGSSQIWLLPLDGGEARQLTGIKGGVSQFKWFPDSQSLAFIANITPDGIEPEDKKDDDSDPFVKYNRDVKVITELFYKLDGVGYFSERRPQLCVIGVDEDAQPEQLTEHPYRVGSITDISPDGQEILFTSLRGKDYDREAWQQHLWAIPACGGEPEQLVGGEYSVRAAAYSPDGKQIAFVATFVKEMGYDNAKLYVQARQGGEPRLVAPDFDRPFAGVVLTDLGAAGSLPLVWANDGASIYAPASIDGAVYLAYVNLASGQMECLTAGEQVVIGYSF